MKKLLTLAVVVGLAGCSIDEFPTYRELSLLSDSAVAAPKAGGYTPEQKAQLCRFVREGMGLPIKVDPAARSKAYEVLGRQQTLELLRPAARSNNAFYCLCGTPAERAKVKC